MQICDQQSLISEECACFQKQLSDLIQPSYPVDVRIVLEHLHAHLFDPDLQIGQACRECGIRDGRFRRIFKRHCHQTMHRYCEDKRLLATLRLFGFEGVEIGCIAFGVGYENYRTFGRAFKRRLGKCPQQIREELTRERRLDLAHLPVDTDPCAIAST